MLRVVTAPERAVCIALLTDGALLRMVVATPFINVVTELLISAAFFVTTSANDFITDSMPGVVRVLPFEIEVLTEFNIP